MRALLIALLLLTALPAMAQDIAPVLDRLERLERDTQNLQLEVFRGEGKAPDNISALASGGLNRIESRLSGLEQTLRQLTGKIEELQFQQQQLQTRSDKTQSDLELRLQTIEQKLQAVEQAQAAVAAVNPPSPPPPASPESPPAPAADAKTAYDAALAQIRQGEYELAEASLRDFIKTNPQHELAGNAQYWLAETLYVRGMFEPASVEFLAGYKTYPKSPKAADSLLKLGLSLGHLQKTKQACASFAQLQKQFPKADSNILNRAQAERKKLGCGKAG
jgi:tol-pal system protein YbgF